MQWEIDWAANLLTVGGESYVFESGQSEWLLSIVSRSVVHGGEESRAMTARRLEQFAVTCQSDE